MLMSAIRNHPRMFDCFTNINPYIYFYLYIYVYMFTPHQGLFFLFFPIALAVSLRGQPSAICYLPKKQCIGEPSPLPPSPSKSPIFFCFFFSVFFPWYPSPSKTQPKTSHPKCLYVYFFWCGGKVAARFLRFCGFSSCILWKLSKAMSSY